MNEFYFYENEFYFYDFRFDYLADFIDKNSLKYFRLSLKMVIEMEKESIEMKLPEPYDDCEEATDNRLEHQSNCIESCVHGKIRKKFNCSILLTLFWIHGLQQCDPQRYSYLSFKREFSPGCLTKLNIVFS
jgi:hypothetical protein